MVAALSGVRRKSHFGDFRKHPARLCLSKWHTLCIFRVEALGLKPCVMRRFRDAVTRSCWICPQDQIISGSAQVFFKLSVKNYMIYRLSRPITLPAHSLRPWRDTSKGFFMVYCFRSTVFILVLTLALVCVVNAEEGQGGEKPSPLATMRDSLAQYGEGESSQTVRDEAQEQSGYNGWNSLYNCLDQLPNEQRIKANAIVSDSLPKLQELDGQIHCKVDELQALTYSDNADPEALPKLGLDLQRLRNELRATLAAVNLRLQREAGVQLQHPMGRGCQSMRVYGQEMQQQQQ